MNDKYLRNSVMECWSVKPKAFFIELYIDLAKVFDKYDIMVILLKPKQLKITGKEEN